MIKVSVYPQEYIQYVVELSEEEKGLIKTIIADSTGVLDIEKLEEIAMRELPLCNPEDVCQEIIKCLNTNFRKPSVIETLLEKADVELRAKPEKVVVPQPNNKEGVSEAGKRWTDVETKLLLDFISHSQGNINWSLCAQFVGSKSGQQCKYKFNNLKVKFATR